MMIRLRARALKGFCVMRVTVTLGRMTLLRGTAALALVLTASCSYRRHVAVTPVPEPVRQSVIVGADTISYERSGDTLSGRPTVVLLHGFGAAMESWSDIQPMIGEDNQQISFN